MEPNIDNQPHRYDVFLSHNSVDKPAVEELARRLIQAGLSPFLDIWHLVPGEPFQEAVEQALDQCATVAVFIGPDGTGPWQHEEMRVAIQRRVDARQTGQRRFRVIPVLLPGAERGERSRLPDFLVQTTWVEFHNTLSDEQAFHRLVAGIRGQAPGPGPGQAAFEGECPYRGLRFFDVQHAPFFFGREALTEWLVDELRRDNRFLAILGPSGSGKSSLARAGLVAMLKQGVLDGSATWPIAIFRPGSRPLESLADTLHGAAGVAATASALRDLIESLRGDQRILHLSVRQALREAPVEARLFLLADQFEEVFTLSRDESERQAFIDNLLYASSVADGRAVVVLAMRADFYPKCAAYPGLATALSDHQVLVGPMADEEIYRAIERPALLTGCELEPGLAQRLQQDIQDQPGGLPLLQDALLELWQRRTGRHLTHKAYEAIGGVEGALELRAEAVYGELNPTEQRICQRIFLRLTQPGEGTEDTKRRVSMRELVPAGEAEEPTEAVVHKLSSEKARLVTTEGEQQDVYVEVAHEALIRGWSRLQDWIDADRTGLIVYRHLAEAADEWARLERDPSILYRGARLAEALEWSDAHPGEPNNQERAFLRASQAAQTRGARLRYGAVVAIAVLLVTALSVFGTSQRQLAVQRGHAQETATVLLGEAQSARQTAVAEADNANLAALRSRSGELAAQAIASIERDPELSILLALEAISTTQTASAEDALRRAMLSSYVAADIPQNQLAMDVAFSPDGNSLAVATWGDPIQIWDSGTRQLVGQLTGHYSPTFQLDYDPAGDRIVSTHSDGTVRLWDARTRTLLRRLSGHSQFIWDVDFAPDGRRIATGSDDGTVVVWDATSGQSVQTLPVTSEVHGVAFNRDGKLLATASQDGVARVWDLATASVVFSQTHVSEAGTAALHDVAFSPTEDLLAVSGEDRAVTFWRPEDGQESPQALRHGHTSTVHSVDFSSDGKRLLSADLAGTVIVWDVSDLTSISELKRLEGHTDLICNAVFDRDGVRVATASYDQSVKLWTVAAHHGWIYDLAFDPKNRDRLVTASADGTARIWSFQEGRLTLLNTLAHGSEVRFAAFSPDGKLIATAGKDRTIKLWHANTGALLRTLEGHTDLVRSVAFSHDGTRIATASYDGQAGLWDVQSGKRIRFLKDGGAIMNDVAFSADDRLIATASDDNLARLWQVDTDEKVSTLAGHSEPVERIAFSPDGSTLATASSDRTAKIWDPVAATAIFTFTEHTDRIIGLAYDSTGRRLATAGMDGLIVVHEVATGRPQAELSAGGEAYGVTFSPDSRYILSVGRNDDISVQALAVEDLVAQARRRLTRGWRPEECMKYLGMKDCPAPTAQQR